MYDKDKIRQALTDSDIYSLLSDWGGQPIETSFGITSTTICHNKPGEGSRKLYYYSNTKLFKCYTECDCAFDVFDLYIKVMKIQHNIEYTLYEAVKQIAYYFNFSSDLIKKDEVEESLDWNILNNYNKINELHNKKQKVVLEEYNNNILKNFNYEIKISPWLKEGITQEVMSFNKIGYYAGDQVITIPHYDIDNRFVGLRCRTLCKEEGEIYGKYHPLKLMVQCMPIL